MFKPQQIRSATPSRGQAHGFRAYPANSPTAKARLTALALWADGRLDDQELDDLERRQAFAKLGLTRDQFFQVLYDLCADVATTPNREDSCLISQKILEGMFAEISEPQEQKVLLRVIFDVIRSDGHLTLGEARLYWSAIDAWHLGPTGHGKKLPRRRSAQAFA